ncbi:hypothetical protein Tco_0269917 [Tanacetum coccineum]
MGGAILTLVSRVKKLERTVKQLRTARLVGDAPATEGDVDIQDEVDLEGLSRMASEAMGHDHPAVPSEDIEEHEEKEVPLRRKRSVHRRAKTAFNTLVFAQFHAPLSAAVLSQAATSASAGPSGVAEKGKAPMPDLDIPAEFVAEDAQARKRFEEEQASERLVQRLRAEDLAQEYMPNVSEERAKELDELMMRMTETDWLNLMMQVGSNPALARELLGADVTEENFVERMTAIKDKKKRALADLRYRALKGKPMQQSEVNQMMRNLVKNQWCAAHNGTITMKAVKAMSKQQLIEEYELPIGCSCWSATFSAAGGAFSAPATDSSVTTIAAMDSAGSSRTIGVSPFADSAADPSSFLSSIAGGPSPSNVTTAHIPLAVLFESTSGGINEFFLESDEEEQIGMSRAAADPESDDEVLAEIIFRGMSISGDGVVLVDKLPDDEIVDPRVKVETISEFASSPPRSRHKHLGVRSDEFLWDKPVEDFFNSESERDDDMENYIPPLPYGAFKDWEISLHPDAVEDFWHTQDEWIVSSWKLYPKRSVHVLDLTNGKTVYMFVDKFYPIRATLLESMLRHRLTVPPSYCRDVVVAGNIIQMVQAGLRQAYECIASAPIACTARQMVFSSPWLTAKKESGSPLQTALVCNSNPLMVARLPKTGCPEQTATGKDMLNPLYGCDGCFNPPWNLPFLGAKGLTSPEQTATGKGISEVLFLTVATSFDLLCIEFIFQVVFPADYVPAGHVLISADRYRIC